MPTSRIEQKVFILKKEAVRGTAEGSAAGGRSLPVMPGSEINFVRALLADTKIYGDPSQRAAQGGIREGTGTLELEPGADKIGELLNSLLGSVVTDQPDFAGAPLVFRHKFKVHATNPLHPLYTLFVDRHTHQKKYEGTAAGQMTFTVPNNGRVACGADLVFKSEKSGAVLTPDFSTDLNDLLFSDIKVFIAGVESSLIHQASVVLNTNPAKKRVLSQTPDAVDIVHGQLNASGTFQIYFEDDAERDKFLAATSSAFKIKAEGQTLQAAQKATLEIDLPLIKYTAGPVGEQDGILVQNFAFRADLDATAGYQAQVTLINKEAAY